MQNSLLFASFVIFLGFVFAGSKQFPSNTTFPVILNEGNPSVTIDYGIIVSGLNSFSLEVLKTKFNSSILFSVSYSETIRYVDQGDWAAVPILSRNSNIDRKTNQSVDWNSKGWKDPQIQGGFRFQKITLLSKGSAVQFNSIDIAPDYYTGDLVGSFRSSSQVYNDMWNIGANTVRWGMIPAKSLYRVFESTPEGFLIPPNRVAYHLKGRTWGFVSKTFNAKILQGGFAFGFGIQMNQHQFTVSFVKKEGKKDQIRLYDAGNYLHSDPFLTQNMSMSLPVGQFFKVNCTVLPVNASINRVEISIGNSWKFEWNGTVDIGVWQGATSFTTFRDQKYVVSDVKIVDTLTQKLYYQNSLKTEDSLDDWGANHNKIPLFIDGTKRDRTVWSGDMLVMTPTSFYTFGLKEYTRESVRLLLSYQSTDGQTVGDVMPNFPVQSGAENDGFPLKWSYTYSICMLEIVHEYWMFTGDLEFVKESWPGLYRTLEYFQENRNKLGLVVTTNAQFDVDWWVDNWGNTNYTKLQLQYAISLDCAAKLTKAMGFTSQSESFARFAAETKKSINENLFNFTKGYFRPSDNHPDIVAQDVNSLAVIHTGLSSHMKNRILDVLTKNLRDWKGYLAYYPSLGIYSAYSTYFHAVAAFETGRVDLAFDIIESTWAEMTNKNGSDYTGGTWERVLDDGTWDPIISHAHGWSSGVSVLLSKYVLGVRPETPGFKTWKIQPHPGRLYDASGVVPTPFGNIKVSWKSHRPNSFSIKIESPNETSGNLIMPFSFKCLVIDGVKKSWERSVPLEGGIHTVSSTNVC